MDWRIIAVLSAVFLYDAFVRLGSETDEKDSSGSNELSLRKPSVDGVAFPLHSSNTLHFLYCSS